jgi:hypothetical protein
MQTLAHRLYRGVLLLTTVVRFARNTALVAVLSPRALLHALPAPLLLVVGNRLYCVGLSGDTRPIAPLPLQFPLSPVYAH